MPSLEKSLDRLTRLPLFEAERPATDEEIEQMQAELSVTLPAQYVQFLKRFGYAGWFGAEVLGIRPIDRKTGEPSAVTPDCVTKSKRERGNPNGTALLPTSHVVISTDGGGGNFVLFADGSPFEGQVHWYNFEDSPLVLKVWKTFQDFLDSLIEDAVDP